MPRLTGKELPKMAVRHQVVHEAGPALAHHRLARIHEETAQQHDLDALRLEAAGYSEQAAVERLYARLEREEARYERKQGFLGSRGEEMPPSAA